ncbi:MAG: hypothetical protein QOE71_749 [Pseudonocardiales bacterium]|nr:hypothetical protein [Pseudonocardiales bacterium]
MTEKAATTSDTRRRDWTRYTKQHTNERKHDMNINFGKRSLAVGLATGVTGAALATVAFTTHSSAPSRPVPPAAASNAVSALPETAAPAATSATPRASAPAAPNLAKVRAIAERAGGGQVEQLERRRATTGMTYQVSVIRPNGMEAQLIIDARNGQVLSNTVEPQDSVEPKDSAEPKDSTGD